MTERSLDLDAGAYRTLGDEAPVPVQPPAPPSRRRLAVLLFVLTCLTTFVAGLRGGFWPGVWYAGAVMTILLTHELGHYFMARRYGIRASLPYFLPFLPPIGTLGALIVMRQQIPDRRALYDIGISGPLAGLVPALFFMVVGIQRATVGPLGEAGGLYFGEPLLLRWIAAAIHGPIPEGSTLWIGPLGMAGWVGIFVTALNLMPIGQLDGGHVLYALLRRRAHSVATLMLYAAIGAVVFFGLWHWTLMLLLLIWVGPKHPPTRNDYVPLGRFRVLLGWLTLAFLIIGFTPVPLSFEP